MKRADYKEDKLWNVGDLYNSIEEFEKEVENLKEKVNKYNIYKGHILDSAKSLNEFLEFDSEFNRKLEKVFIYAHIQNDQDTTDIKFQILFGKVYKFYEEYSEITSYVVPELLKENMELIDKYIKEEPKLQRYERTLKEVYRFKNHTLSENEERLLSSLKCSFKVPDEVFSYLTDADLKFGKVKNEEGKLVELTEKTYKKFMESENRNVRKSAFNKLLSTYGSFKNTYASLLGSEVSKNNKLAKIRNYSDALTSSLYGNEIDPIIYTNLINAVKNNVKPLSKFWNLKKQMLGVSSLHIYDTYAPIVNEVKQKYSEDEAKELLFKSLSVLGDEYINDFKKAFDERWIDYPPNDGKRNGAYCTACYEVHPYVLMSYDGTLGDVSTLAHELGHAMHYYYAIHNQSFEDYSYSIFVAEVASQVNQILLSKYLINNTNKKSVKMYLIDDLIQDFKSTIYRQTMFADFEKTIYEKEMNGEVLTHELLSETYYDLNKAYYGKNIVVDEIIKYEWARIPHFYMKFYVYQYATAYAAAIHIAMDILSGNKDAQSNYMKFLKLGCSINPIDSLKVAGVDMTKPDALNSAFSYFEDLVDELSSLIIEGGK